MPQPAATLVDALAVRAEERLDTLVALIVKHGERVEIEIEGIGVLSNPVVRR